MLILCPWQVEKITTPITNVRPPLPSRQTQFHELGRYSNLSKRTLIILSHLQSIVFNLLMTISLLHLDILSILLTLVTFLHHNSIHMLCIISRTSPTFLLIKQTSIIFVEMHSFVSAYPLDINLVIDIFDYLKSNNSSFYYYFKKHD